MNHHGLLWPESLGPRPDGIGSAYGAPMPDAAGAPPFPSSDYAPYASRIGSPYGENYSFGDVEDQFYYYGQRPCDGDQSIDPWLRALMEDLRELYVRRRHRFQQFFPRLHDEIERKLEDALRSKRTREVRAFQRSLSVGSPGLPGRDGGAGDEPALRLDRFKVRMVDLDDDVEGGGPQGGAGGETSAACRGALRLNRFKVRTVELDDDVEGGGPQGGAGGETSAAGRGALRLDRFKVRTFDLDDVEGGGPQGGAGGETSAAAAAEKGRK